MNNDDRRLAKITVIDVPPIPKRSFVKKLWDMLWRIFQGLWKILTWIGKKIFHLVRMVRKISKKWLLIAIIFALTIAMGVGIWKFISYLYSLIPLDKLTPSTPWFFFGPPIFGFVFLIGAILWKNRESELWSKVWDYTAKRERKEWVVFGVLIVSYILITYSWPEQVWFTVVNFWFLILLTHFTLFLVIFVFRGSKGRWHGANVILLIILIAVDIHEVWKWREARQNEIIAEEILAVAEEPQAGEPTNADKPAPPESGKPSPIPEKERERKKDGKDTKGTSEDVAKTIPSTSSGAFGPDYQYVKAFWEAHEPPLTARALTRICQWESGCRQFDKNGKVVSNQDHPNFDGTVDYGLMAINSIHLKDARDHKIDVMEKDGNLLEAKRLFDKAGFQPWMPSIRKHQGMDVQYTQPRMEYQTQITTPTRTVPREIVVTAPVAASDDENDPTNWSDEVPIDPRYHCNFNVGGPRIKVMKNHDPKAVFVDSAQNPAHLGSNGYALNFKSLTGEPVEVKTTCTLN